MDRLERSLETPGGTIDSLAGGRWSVACQGSPLDTGRKLPPAAAHLAGALQEYTSSPPTRADESSDTTWLSVGQAGDELDPALKAFIDRVVVPGLVEFLLRGWEQQDAAREPYQEPEKNVH